MKRFIENAKIKFNYDTLIECAMLSDNYKSTERSGIVC